MAQSCGSGSGAGGILGLSVDFLGDTISKIRARQCTRNEKGYSQTLLGPKRVRRNLRPSSVPSFTARVTLHGATQGMILRLCQGPRLISTSSDASLIVLRSVYSISPHACARPLASASRPSAGRRGRPPALPLAGPARCIPGTARGTIQL